MTLFLPGNCRIALLSLICLSLPGCSNPGMKRLSLGKKDISEKRLLPDKILFESNLAGKAIRYTDSAFALIKEPTVYDYVTYYHMHVYYSGFIRASFLQKKYLDSCIDIVRSRKLEKVFANDLPTWYAERGTALYKLQKYDEAYGSLYESYRLSVKYSDNCNISNSVYNIGMIMFQQQQYDSAAAYFKTALHYINLCDMVAAYRNNKIQELLDNVALCYTKNIKLDSALKYYQDALRFVEQKQDELAIDKQNSRNRYYSAKGVIMDNMAKVYVLKNDLDSAILFYNRSVALNSLPATDHNDMQLSLMQLASIYLQQLDIAALGNTLDTLRQSFRFGVSEQVKTDYTRLMYQYYNHAHQPEKALHYLSIYTQRKDSSMIARGRTRQENIGEELRDKDREFQIQLLQKSNQIDKIYVWLLSIFFVMSVIIIGLVFYLFKKNKQSLRQSLILNDAMTFQKRDLETVNINKDRILNIVAHDLRSPIGAIASFLDILIVKYEHSADEKRVLEASRDAAFRSLNLISDLLEFNTIQSGRLTLYKTPADIVSLIKKAIEQIEYKTISKEQSIRFTTDTDKRLVKIDAEKIQRVLANLLDNAIKFSHVKGVIEVHLSGTAQEKVTIEIKDYGVGIPDEIKDKLFDASFVSKKRSGTGNETSNGLGLSICKQIVEAHAGSIRLHSVAGKGSTFSIELPVI